MDAAPSDAAPVPAVTGIGCGGEGLPGGVPSPEYDVYVWLSADLRGSTPTYILEVQSGLLWSYTSSMFPPAGATWLVSSPTPTMFDTPFGVVRTYGVEIDATGAIVPTSRAVVDLSGIAASRPAPDYAWFQRVVCVGTGTLHFEPPVSGADAGAPDAGPPLSGGASMSRPGVWTPVGSVEWLPSGVRLVARADNDVWVGAPDGLRHWDGVTWTLADPGPVDAPLWVASATELLSASGLQLRRWTGAAWNTVGTLTPMMGCASGPWRVRAIHGTSPSDVWVGISSGCGGEMLHWNGTSQDRATSFMWTPAGIFARSAVDVWMVTYSLGPARGMHWDGTTWSAPYSLGYAGDTTLHVYAVTGNASTTVAATDTGLARWDGANFGPIPMTGGLLFDVSLPSTTLGWAVGTAGRVMRFDGTGWRDEPAFTVDHLGGLWASPTGHVWVISTPAVPGRATVWHRTP